MNTIFKAIQTLNTIHFTTENAKNVIQHLQLKLNVEKTVAEYTLKKEYNTLIIKTNDHYLKLFLNNTKENTVDNFVFIHNNNNIRTWLDKRKNKITKQVLNHETEEIVITKYWQRLKNHYNS